MFGKSDLVDSLNRDLARARDRRETLASDVTMLTSRIAELEARLSAENERRERERTASEIEEIKKRLRQHYLEFAPVIAWICDATEIAAGIVPEAREVITSLDVIATEVGNAIDGLLCNLDLRMEAVRAGNVSAELPQSLNGSPKALRLVHAELEEPDSRSSEVLQSTNDTPSLPEWLPRRKPAAA